LKNGRPLWVIPAILMALATALAVIAFTIWLLTSE
jgi:hypothetical protein